MPRGQNRNKPPIGGPQTPLQKLDKRIETAQANLTKYKVALADNTTTATISAVKRAENALDKLLNERADLQVGDLADVEFQPSEPTTPHVMNITYHTADAFTDPNVPELSPFPSPFNDIYSPVVPETPVASTDVAEAQEREELTMTETAVEEKAEEKQEKQEKTVKLIASVPPPFVRKTSVRTKASGPRKGKYDAEVAYAFENPDQHWQIVDGDGEPVVFETTSIKQSMKKKYGDRTDEEGRSLSVITRRAGDKAFLVWLLVSEPSPAEPEAVNGESVVVGDDDADPGFFDDEGGIVQDN